MLRVALHLLVQKRCFGFAVSTTTHEHNTKEHHPASFAFGLKNTDSKREINTDRANGTLLQVTRHCPSQVSKAEQLRDADTHQKAESTHVRCKVDGSQAWLDEGLHLTQGLP